MRSEESEKHSRTHNGTHKEIQSDAHIEDSCTKNNNGRNEGDKKKRYKGDIKKVDT